MPTIRFHPSTKTNMINFSGKLTIVGGSMIIPSDVVTLVTTRSITRNGMIT